MKKNLVLLIVLALLTGCGSTPVTTTAVTPKTEEIILPEVKEIPEEDITRETKEEIKSSTAEVKQQIQQNKKTVETYSTSVSTSTPVVLPATTSRPVIIGPAVTGDVTQPTTVITYEDTDTAQLPVINQSTSTITNVTEQTDEQLFTTLEANELMPIVVEDVKDEYSEYNNKEVDRTAIYNLLDSDLAILVQTNVVNYLHPGTALNYGLVLKQSNNNPKAYTREDANIIDTLERLDSDRYITTDAVPYAITVDINQDLTLSADGTYYVSEPYLGTGHYMFNKEIKGLFEYGNAAYLINSKIYKSNLIKDNNDQVIGVLFKQVN